jgi:uncharacterized protein (DUF2249 family)
MKPEFLTIDVRSLLPSHRHPVIFAILERLGEIRAPQVLQVVSDHKPVGLPMELEMRDETKGRYDFSAGQREDGDWLNKIKLKE